MGVMGSMRPLYRSLGFRVWDLGIGACESGKTHVETWKRHRRTKWKLGLCI